jgi:hypothetical protein
LTACIGAAAAGPLIGISAAKADVPVSNVKATMLIAIRIG